MLAEIIIAILLFALISFVYYGIIAPSTRMELRYELFELRDRTRLLMASTDSRISEKQIHLLHGSINNAISALSTIDAFALAKVKRELSQDKALQERVQKAVATVTACRSAEFQEIHEKSARIVFYACIINMGMLILLLLPFFVLGYCIEGIKNKMVNSIKKRINVLSCVPERDFGRVFTGPSAA